MILTISLANYSVCIDHEVLDYIAELLHELSSMKKIQDAIEQHDIKLEKSFEYMLRDTFNGGVIKRNYSYQSDLIEESSDEEMEEESKAEIEYYFHDIPRDGVPVKILLSYMYGTMGELIPTSKKKMLSMLYSHMVTISSGVSTFTQSILMSKIFQLVL